jgi:hypothetical protein
MSAKTKLSEAILSAEARARLAENQGRILDARKLWLSADDLRQLWTEKYANN